MAGGGAHEVGFVFLDADLVHAGDSAPEADEVLDFGGIALHAHHLGDDLDGDAAFVLESGEADEVVADFLKARAFAVELVAFLGGSIEAHGDVLQRGGKETEGGVFVEEGAVGGEEGGDAVRFAVVDAVKDLRIEEWFAEPDEHHVLGRVPGFPDEPLEDLAGHVLFRLLVGFAGTHGTVEITLGCGLDDVFHRQRAHIGAPGEVGPQQFGSVPGPHGETYIVAGRERKES